MLMLHGHVLSFHFQKVPTVVGMGEKAEVENSEKELMKDFEEQEPPRKRTTKRLHHIEGKEKENH